MDKPVFFKKDFPEIYFLGSDLRRYDTCQFGLLINNKILCFRFINQSKYQILMF